MNYSWRLAIPDGESDVNGVVLIKVLNLACYRDVFAADLLSVASGNRIKVIYVCLGVWFLRNDLKNISLDLLRKFFCNFSCSAFCAKYVTSVAI